MKKSLFTLCISCLLALTTFAQTIRRVNKTPGLNDPSIYNSVQAAHDASAPGDIIYVEPTDVASGNYDPTTSPYSTILNRRVNIIGTGYDLSLTSNTSFDKRNVKLGALTFENGSAGSTVMGMEISSTIYIRDSSITVSRCTFSTITLSTASQLVGGVYSKGNYAKIINNRITSSISGGERVNCIISNNVFTQPYASISDLIGAVINYNTFYGGTSGSTYINNIDGSTVTNNIFDARGATIGFSILNAASNGTTVSNNLCTNVAGLPTGGGNVNSVNPALVFMVSNPWTVNPFTDANLELAVSSPARTVGQGSTPIGAFAGNRPYVLSGVPNVPVTTAISNNGTGTTATPLNVNISIRSNN